MLGTQKFPNLPPQAILLPAGKKGSREEGQAGQEACFHARTMGVFNIRCWGGSVSSVGARAPAPVCATQPPPVPAARAQHRPLGGAHPVSPQAEEDGQ